MFISNSKPHFGLRPKYEFMGTWRWSEVNDETRMIWCMRCNRKRMNKFINCLLWVNFLRRPRDKGLWAHNFKCSREIVVREWRKQNQKGEEAKHKCDSGKVSAPFWSTGSSDVQRMVSSRRSRAFTLYMSHWLRPPWGSLRRPGTTPRGTFSHLSTQAKWFQQPRAVISVTDAGH